MNKQLVRVFVLISILSMMFWIMSCQTGPQNVNVNQNQNIRNPNTAAAVPTPPNDACQGLTNIDDKVREVGNDVNTSVNTDNGLANQRDGNEHPNKIPNFKYRVGKAGTGSFEHVVIVIEGKISDGHGNQPARLMRELAHLIQKNVKRGCVYRIVFVPKGTLPASDTALVDFEKIQGFEWSACEWPNVACSNGECKPSCDGIPMGTPKPAPSPTAPRGNNNSNANSNRPGTP